MIFEKRDKRKNAICFVKQDKSIPFRSKSEDTHSKEKWSIKNKTFLQTESLQRFNTHIIKTETCPKYCGDRV